MMRSLYSGVAGLKTHQTKMDVIGNNIANVNTTAYKSSSITFSDLMSQTTQKASGANATTGTGGVNARQIGLGVKSGAISMKIDSQGSAQSTGNPFDIMITGSNFFVVNNGNGNYFTRDGSFYVDGAGNLAMTSTGYNVMGWGVDEETGSIKQDNVTALRIMSAANMTYEPEATSKAYIAGILDKNDTDVNSANGKALNLNFYDDLGYNYTARLVFKQSSTPGNYSVELTKILDSQGNSIDISALDEKGPFGENNQDNIQKVNNVFTLTDGYKWNGTTLEKNGKAVTLKDGTTPVTIASLSDATNGAEARDIVAAAYNMEGSTDYFFSCGNAVTDADGVTTIPDGSKMLALLASGPNEITTDARTFDGVAVNFSTETGVFAGVNGLNAASTTGTLDLSALGGNFSNIEIDFSDMSMFNNNGTSTVTATSGDKDGIGSGRMLGDMIGVSIQNNGMIYASYDNGMTKLLGQIATADFPNASGLEKAGDNLYQSTLNSGEFDGIGVDVTANGGYMTTGTLEMSNVDLSTEFTDMITTQRGFQANSRIITVSDTLLEELTNLKR